MQNPDIDFFQKAIITNHVKNTKHQKPSGKKPMQLVFTCQNYMVIAHDENDQIPF
jgi:hypothetical protein